MKNAWRFTGFYREQKVSRRKFFWQTLKDLGKLFSITWLCMEDFNKKIFTYEYEGVVGRAQWQMTDFRKALDETGLTDMGYVGPKFTWWNKTNGQGSVCVRNRQGYCLALMD